MYTLENLCRDIALPEEVTARVLDLDKVITAPCHKLRQEETWESGLQELEAALAPDPDGFGMLTCQLRCALECREDLQKLGFPQEVYIDTMKCFSRFVGEHMVSFGRYGFDRGFWTVRQVSAKLVRIGVLEYEVVIEDGQKAISIHIPSDACLEKELLRQSYLEAKKLLIPAYPEFADAPWGCGSWLLAPVLKEMLPENSRILIFQSGFTVLKTYPDPEFKEWVYKRVDIPDADLPENTSLQRKLKAYLLAGNAFHSGMGMLIEDPYV